MSTNLVCRPYQRQSVDGVLEKWREGFGSTLVISATGTGKSLVACQIVRELNPRGKLLYVVHREELAQQAKERFRKHCGVSVQLETAEKRRGRDHDGSADVIVAMVQSLEERHDLYGPDEFQYVMTDESHRFVGNSWADTVRRYRGKRCGFTATPYRLDGAAMSEEYESVAFNYPIDFAIRDGWIVPFRWRLEQCREIDLRQIEVRDGDFVKADLDRVMEKDSVVRFVVDRMICASGDHQGMVFCSSVTQVLKVRHEFMRRGKTAMTITSETDNWYRGVCNQDFRDGATQFAVGCDVFTEGFDHPGIFVIGNAAMTMSESRFRQRAGRGSRTIGEPEGETAAQRRQWIRDSRKSSCLLLDFVGESTLESVFLGVDVCGVKISDDVRDEAIRIMAGTGKSLLIDDLKEMARSSLLNGDRKFDFASELKFIKEHVPDPLEVVGIKLESSTINQQEAYEVFRAAKLFLEQCGLSDQEINRLSQIEVAELMVELKIRASDGMCSYPQARKLWNLGYFPELMSSSAASITLRASRDAGGVRPETDGPNMRFRQHVISGK